MRRLICWILVTAWPQSRPLAAVTLKRLDLRTKPAKTTQDKLVVSRLADRAVARLSEATIPKNKRYVRERRLFFRIGASL
jgi:hypothetical protein